MPKDTRIYARFTVDFPDDPKIAGLSDRAYRVLTEMIMWSRKHETDGFIPRAVADAKQWAQQSAQQSAQRSATPTTELTSNHPSKPSLSEHQSGWQIHDFDKQQDTRAEIEARREQARAAGQRGGLASAQRSAQRSARRSAQQRLKPQLSIERDNLATQGPTGLAVAGSGTRDSATPNGAAAPPAARPPTAAAAAVPGWQPAQYDPAVDHPPTPELTDQAFKARANIQHTLDQIAARREQRFAPPDSSEEERPWQ